MKKALYVLVVSIALIGLVVPVSYGSSTLDRTIKFCVFSDPHYYDPTLGTTGSAFQAYLAQESKMFAESDAILSAAIKGVMQESPDFLLIPGDLTKDGENVCHRKFAGYLKSLTDLGIKVYVVPGNHDVLNAHSCSFSGSSMTSVPSITPEDFSTLYAQFGYADAIARDPNSLSYIAEPVSGVWLFALDACRYKENTQTTVQDGGQFSSNTLAWILNQLQNAKSKDKTVIGMMHHGVMEHYTGQKAFFPDYVVDNFQSVDSLFVRNGMNWVFTGHYHSQDIVMEKIDGNVLYDIETGSIVTFPSPYRTITLTPDLKMNIKSTTIQSIEYDTQGKTFQKYAEDFLTSGLNLQLTYTLTAPPEQGGYGFSLVQVAPVIPLLVDASKAHYAGDEMPSIQTMATISVFMKSSDANTKLVGQILGALWTDLPPADNNVTLESTIPTSVEEDLSVGPISIVLGQNYPNPFNPSTNIHFTVKSAGAVKISVYDIAGQKIATLVDGVKTPGNYIVKWNAKGVASGSYLCVMENGGKTLSRKMTFMK